MDTQYLTTDAWAMLEQRHPAAYAFLLSQSLHQEREVLHLELFRLEAFYARLRELYLVMPDSDYKRLVWVRQRVSELDAHFSNATFQESLS